MATADTPLSDAISRILAASSTTEFGAFVSTFRGSTVGVIATALPPGLTPGQAFQAGAGNVELVVVGTPDGRRMLKACADPEVFVTRFPDTPINALMVVSPANGYGLHGWWY